MSTVDPDIVGPADVLRQIWQESPFLMSHIPALDEGEDTNRFYDEGEGLMRLIESDSPDLPEKFAILQDAGTTERTRASAPNGAGRRRELKAGFIVMVVTHSKALTRRLKDSYLGDIERELEGYGRPCSLGVIGDWDLESETMAAAGRRLWIWTGQLTLTIHGTRPWQTFPLAQTPIAPPV